LFSVLVVLWHWRRVKEMFVFGAGRLVALAFIVICSHFLANRGA